MSPAPSPSPIPHLPEAAVLVAGIGGAWWLTPQNEVEALSHRQAASRLAASFLPIVCHAPATARRLDVALFHARDILELFAFIRPARFCLPTPRGVAAALDLPLPKTPEDETRALASATQLLLEELSLMDPHSAGDVLSLAEIMEGCGWPWGATICRVFENNIVKRSGPSQQALEVWRRLKEWGEYAPEPPGGQEAVTADEATSRLESLLGPEAESRPQQMDYAAGVTTAFIPREEADDPRVALAEAGTGVGKTLGYLAPASLWAQKNHGPVWISTYTRNLQHQIDGELGRLYPQPNHKAAKAVIRKGRENYLCLLNLEEAVGALAGRPPASRERDATALGLFARWTGATRDGDMVGGDFPAWLSDLLGRGRTYGLADRRGECIFSSCTHFRKCFIERSVRRSRRAEIVIANHALVMVQAALGGGEDDDPFVPARYVFDEGHHVFEAADSAFSAHLTGLEMVELRRWILGSEGREGRLTAGRMRGLKRRIGDVADSDKEAATALENILEAARALPAEGWMKRVNQSGGQGAADDFLRLIRSQIYARSQQPGNVYSLETECLPLVEGIGEAAAGLESALAALSAPLTALARRLRALLDENSSDMETADRLRVEAISRGLMRRAENQVEAWRAMLRSLESETPPDFVDWFSVERREGRDYDLGMHRHWIDPTKPFIESVARPAQGVLITSATLRDATPADETGWMTAQARTGAAYLPSEPTEIAVPSPFDYPRQTRVFVVTDVNRDNSDQVAAAYRELFLAGGGGGLGLFTAIARLRAIYERIATPLDEAGIPLLAQHVDGLDTATLVDIFRSEHDSCLLGTDAVRDGVDVPGRALHLIVFDRVPWPRPSILHRARRQAFGGGLYDDMLTRLRLKQAFGRLVRKAGDKGVFILLDNRMPSRLATAFPEDVEVRRIGLAEAVAATRDFLRHT